jgi:copper(I)-binding protein
MRRIVAAAIITIAAVAAENAMAGPKAVAVEHAWSRATPRGAATGVVYAMILNSGTSDDRIVSASSPVAAGIRFHSASNENGVMKMTLLPALQVSPGMPVVLKPGSTHMMLIGLKQQLKEGQSFPLTLMFEKAGAVEVSVRVGKIGALDEPSASTSGGG